LVARPLRRDFRAQAIKPWAFAFTAASLCGGLAERAKLARDTLHSAGADADLQHAVASLQEAQANFDLHQCAL
jgi:hypothetical protein